jgi:hypothetical protein
MTQADTTTTVVEQPIQQSQISNAEALERAKANDTRMPIKLDSSELYNEFEQFGDEPRKYRDGAAVTGEYWMYRFRGAIVNMSPAFKDEFDKGTIQSIVATPTVGERAVSDPMNAGMMKQQIVYGYSITFSGAEALQKALNAKKAAQKLKIEMLVQEKTEAMRVDATIAAITPEKIAELVKPEDIDKILAAM